MRERENDNMDTIGAMAGGSVDGGNSKEKCKLVATRKWPGIRFEPHFER